MLSTQFSTSVFTFVRNYRVYVKAFLYFVSLSAIIKIRNLSSRDKGGSPYHYKFAAIKRPSRQSTEMNFENNGRIVLQCKSHYSVQTRENTDQKKLRIRKLFLQYVKLLLLVKKRFLGVSQEFFFNKISLRVVVFLLVSVLCFRNKIPNST